MTRSVERLAGRSWRTSRPLALFTIAITGSIGVSGVVVAFMRPDHRLVNACVGAFMLSTSLMVLTGQRRSRAGWRSARLDGRPSWVVRLGDPGQFTSTAAVLITLGGGLALVAVLDGRAGVAVAAGLPAAFLLVVAAEMVRASIRRPEVRISAERIELHGTGIDSRLDWDEVAAVTSAHLASRWAAIVVEAVPDATSYEWRLSRLLLRGDREPDPPGIHLRLGQVTDTSQLRRLLRALHAMDERGREALIAGALPADRGF
jgi:hypothetical protein